MVLGSPTEEAATRTATNQNLKILSPMKKAIPFSSNLKKMS